MHHHDGMLFYCFYLNPSSNTTNNLLKLIMHDYNFFAVLVLPYEAI